MAHQHQMNRIPQIQPPKPPVDIPDFEEVTNTPDPILDAPTNPEETPNAGVQQEETPSEPAPQNKPATRTRQPRQQKVRSVRGASKVKQDDEEQSDRNRISIVFPTKLAQRLRIIKVLTGISVRDIVIPAAQDALDRRYQCQSAVCSATFTIAGDDESEFVPKSCPICGNGKLSHITFD